MTRAAELPALQASPEVLGQARRNCAARAEARGSAELAASYRAGGQDEGWAVRFEVAKLHAEARAGL